MVYFTSNYQDTIKLGKKIASKISPGDIITLNGSLGSGKTVFSKGVAKGLNIIEEITSPTYNIICEYKGILPLYHMDLYRIDTYEEFEMLGAEELLFGSGVCLIEWSERIKEFLPPDIISVNIEIINNNERKIEILGLNNE